MAATIGTFNSILKEYYLGPIQEQLNQEAMVVELFEKASVDWNGRQVWIPVHLGRNNDTGFSPEGGALPGAPPAAIPPVVVQPSQTYGNLVVTAQFLYGRFALTGPAMAAAGKGGANSFVGYVDAEMTRLKDDIRQTSDRACTSGGLHHGYVSNTNWVSLAAPGGSLINFDGDFAKVQAVVTQCNLFGVLHMYDLVTTDQYFNATAAGGPAQQIQILGVDPIGRTLQVCSSAGGPLAFDDAAINAIAAGSAPNNAAGFAWSLRLSPASLLVPQVAAAGGVADPQGVYGNLSDPNHFGIARDMATVAVTPANAVMRSTCVSNFVPNSGGGAAPGAGVRQAQALATYQVALDQMWNTTGTTPDLILCNAVQRTILVGLLQGGLSFNTDDRTRAKEIDPGFTGFHYAGIPIKVGQNIDNGMLIFMDTKTWKLCELEGPGFADLDGSILSRVPNSDQWEGFYRWYYNTVCVRPNAQRIVFGLT